MDFLYSNLSPNDFEILCQDLISHIIGERFERFKAGKDSGIDLRLLNQGDKIIVQVKHCPGSYGSSHKSMLKNEFKAAINHFKNGERYILITSLGLSPLNKSEIKGIAQGLIRSDDDIIGIDEIEDILKKCPDIVKRHYKLWISSTAVMMRLLNNGIYGKSDDYLAKVRHKVKLFVTTNKFSEAQHLLSNKKLLLITGDPGVGKTMLAEMLSLAYVGKEYQFIYADDVKDADEVFDKEAKQIFLLDDFLGSNYLEFIEGKMESRILRFIDRITMYKNKKMIMNSRTTIFNNALMKGVHLQDKAWKDIDCILEVKNYTNTEKAQILYNHLAFKGLEDCYLEFVKVDRRYLDIVKHKNFNPRIIEFITSDDKIEGKKGDEYLSFVMESLENPSSIWESAYRNQIDDESKILIQCLFSFGGSVYESRLKNAFERRLQIEVEKSNIRTSDSPFNNALKMLLDGFVKREILKLGSHKYVTISFINPSISDFMVNYVRSRVEIANRMFSSIAYIEQMSILVQYSVIENIMDIQSFQVMINDPEQFSSMDHENKSVAILNMIYENKILIDKEVLVKLLNDALVDNIKSYELEGVCKSLLAATDSLNTDEIQSLFPNGADYFKRLLDGCRDFADLDMVMSAGERLGVNAHRIVKGSKDIRRAIDDVVELESNLLLANDYDLNNAYEATRVKQRLSALKGEIRNKLIKTGIRYKGSLWTFDNADIDEIVNKNITANEEGDDEVVNSTSSDGGDSDFDIDAVFRS